MRAIYLSQAIRITDRPHIEKYINKMNLIADCLPWLFLFQTNDRDVLLEIPLFKLNIIREFLPRLILF